MRFDITETKQQMSEIQQQIDKLMEEAREKGKAAFSEACKKLFDAYPELKAFRWTQYTPYFCDGDTCEFGVNENRVQFTIPIPADKKIGYDWADDEFYEVFTHGDKQVEPFAEITKAVDSVTGLLNEDTCLSLFGDHVEVTVDRDGVTTRGYEHD